MHTLPLRIVASTVLTSTRCRAFPSTQLITLPAIPPPSLVSIVIPTFNSQRYIRQCLQSVARQTYAAIELIIVDGGSTDGTMDIVAQSSLALAAVECRGGLLAARVLGGSLSHGPFIFLLDSDQVIAPDLIYRAVALMDARAYDMLALEEQVRAPHTFTERILSLDKRLIHAESVLDPFRGVILPRFFRRWLWQAAVSAVPPNIVQSVGGQDHSIIFAEAWSYSQRIGLLPNAVEHQEASSARALVHKGFRWGYTSVALTDPTKSSARYRTLRHAKVRLRPGTFRPALWRESLGSLCVLALKGAPYLLGVACAATWGRAKGRFMRPTQTD